MKELTERQRLVLNFIARFIDEHSYPPTFRQIADHFKITVKAAYDHVTALKKKQKLRMLDKSSRTMEIIGSVSDDNDDEQKCFKDIPILGKVAAGPRILSEENYLGSIRIHRSMLKKQRRYFALIVCGDSMTGAGVMDGDTVIIEKNETAKNGDIVVAMIDDGYTIKRFFKRNKSIKLQSENPAYYPIYCNDVRIVGHLACVIRSY
ncbi:MAG: transcriptional repressor LexA [Spirochaetaceae bacterium]|jgi:repressor LexA|nr:transcriptional repressor LexA [Spirochaetaceae bacterium]